jgi:hypothetical protein
MELTHLNSSTEYIFNRFLEWKGRFYITRITIQHCECKRNRSFSVQTVCLPILQWLNLCSLFLNSSSLLHITLKIWPHERSPEDLIIPHATKLCGYNVFDPSVHPCVIVCCHQDSAYVCWWIYIFYTKLWKVVSNLSRGSLFCEGDLVKFVS